MEATEEENNQFTRRTLRGFGSGNFEKSPKIASNAPKCFKMPQKCRNKLKCFQIASKCFKTPQNASKCFKNAPKCFKMPQNA